MRELKPREAVALAELLESVQTCAERLARISTQLAAIDAQLYQIRTQPRTVRS